MKRYRHSLATLNSHLESMGVQHRARTNQGFFIKLHASLLAIICTNLD